MKIAVMGSGGWGTALALVLLENGHDVTLWSYPEEESRGPAGDSGRTPCSRACPCRRTLKLTVRSWLCEGLRSGGACHAVLCRAHQTARLLGPLLEPGAVVVSVSKGIEKDTSLTLTQAIEEEVGQEHPMVALSGPSHAEEVGRQRAHGGGVRLPEPGRRPSWCRICL